MATIPEQVRHNLSRHCCEIKALPPSHTHTLLLLNIEIQMARTFQLARENLLINAKRVVVKKGRMPKTESREHKLSTHHYSKCMAKKPLAGEMIRTREIVKMCFGNNPINHTHQPGAVQRNVTAHSLNYSLGYT